MNLLFSADSATWLALPYVGNGKNKYDPNIDFTVSSSNIEVRYQPQLDSGSIAEPSTTTYVKITLIPVQVMVKHPKTNWNDAKEVAALPEVKAVLNK